MFPFAYCTENSHLEFKKKLRQSLFSMLISWLVISILWVSLLLMRPYTLQPHCALGCAPWFAFDALAVGQNSGLAEEMSLLGQWLGGVLGLFGFLGLPYLLNFLFMRQKRAILPLQSLWCAALWVFCISLNGLMIEVSHLMGQRPRPFVLASPSIEGLNPSNYSSFYSGHTSFVASSLGSLFFFTVFYFGFIFFRAKSSTVNSNLLVIENETLNRTKYNAGHGGANETKNEKDMGALFFVKELRFSQVALILSLFLSWQILTYFTGLMRVFAGKHFPSDILAGAIAGSVIGFFGVYYWSFKYYLKDSKKY